MLLISISQISLLYNVIATFTHMDSTAYFIVVEKIKSQIHKSANLFLNSVFEVIVV
jgi:hypothetical protein